MIMFTDLLYDERLSMVLKFFKKYFTLFLLNKRVCYFTYKYTILTTLLHVTQNTAKKCLE